MESSVGPSAADRSAGAAAAYSAPTDHLRATGCALLSCVLRLRKGKRLSGVSKSYLGLDESSTMVLDGDVHRPKRRGGKKRTLQMITLPLHIAHDWSM